MTYSGLVGWWDSEECYPLSAAHLYIHRREAAIPPPSEPFEPFEPSEPSRRRRVQRRYHHPRPEGPSPLSTQPAAERRPQPFAQRAKPLAAKPPLNPHAHRRVKKDLQSMDFLCIIRTIIKHKARGPAYFGMQAFSILEVAVMILHYGEG